jgi:hypothetical protein
MIKEQKIGQIVIQHVSLNVARQIVIHVSLDATGTQIMHHLAVTQKIMTRII